VDPRTDMVYKRAHWSHGSSVAGIALLPWGGVSRLMALGGGVIGLDGTTRAWAALREASLT
jgi:hypothetical protein